ncbi:hypothetical protein Tco_0609273 [Tanacetum coccineum]
MRKEKEKKKKDRRKDEEKETKKERKERKKETNVMLFGEERRFMGAGAERGSCLMTLYIELLGLMGIPRSWNMWVCCVWGVPAGLWIGEQAYEIGFLWILGRSGERVVRGGMGCGRLVGCVRGCGLLELWDGVLVVGCGEVIVTGCNGGWWCGRWDTWVGDCWGVLMWCKVAVVGGWSGSVWGAGGGEGTCGLWLAGGWFGCEVLLGCGAGCCWGGGAGRDSGMVVWDGGGGAMRQGCGVEIWWGMGDTVALWGGVAGLWLAGLVIVMGMRSMDVIEGWYRHGGEGLGLGRGILLGAGRGDGRMFFGVRVGVWWVVGVSCYCCKVWTRWCGVFGARGYEGLWWRETGRGAGVEVVDRY